MLLVDFRAVDFFVPALVEREALDFLAPDFEELERPFDDDLLVGSGDLAITCILPFSASKSTGTHLPSEETNASFKRQFVSNKRGIFEPLYPLGICPQKSSVPTKYQISEAAILHRNNINLGRGSDAALEEIGTLVATNRTHANGHDDGQ